MSNHRQSRNKGASSSGERRKSALLWTWAAILALVIPGLIAVKWPRSSPKSHAPSPQSSPPLREREKPASDSDKDRVLRQEQLETAKALLSEFPTNDDAVYLVGLIHEDQGNTEEAMKLWSRSIELDATRADANESLGKALLLRDDYAGAEKHLRQALQIESNSPSARFHLAKALSQQGQLQEALSTLERNGPLTLTVSPNGGEGKHAHSAEEYRLMGEICQQLKQQKQARSNYEAAIRLKPDFHEAYYGLAQTLAQLGESEKSREYLEKSSTLRKEADEQARRVRANFDSLAVTRQSVARTHTDVGRVYITVGQPQKAEELWLRAVALDPKNVLCRLQLAVLYQQMRKDREALPLYEQAAKLDPRDGLTQLNMGRVCMRLNQIDGAERAFKEVIRLEPKRPEGYHALAQVYLQTRKNLAEAEQLARTATELAPEAAYFAVLSQARAQNGNRDGALAAINRAIELQPSNPQFVQMRNSILAMK